MVLAQHKRLRGAGVISGVFPLVSRLGIAFSAFGILLAANSVHAAGFAWETADTDILFEPGTVSTEDSITYIDPNRHYDKKPSPPRIGNGDLSGKKYSTGYVIPSLAAKVQFSDAFACALTYTKTNGGETDNDGIIDRQGKTRESFYTDEYGATCRVSTDVGKSGRLSFLGGVFLEDFNYKLDAVTFGPRGLTPLNVKLQDEDLGWRAGVAYEIPDIAFRTELMYRSGTDFKATGDAKLTDLGMDMPAQGFGGLPQSVELKMQTGIAPDWLAFGSVKWEDWSELQRLHLRFGPSDFYNEYHWKDGFTVSGGVGHKFNDTFSGFASLTWNKGVSTGWDLMGDTETVAAGVSIHDKLGGDTRLTAALIHNDATSESEWGALNSSTKSSWGYGLQAQYKIKFN